jgi:hypothetical protein
MLAVYGAQPLTVFPMEALLFKAGENVEAVRKITQETPRLYP